MRATPQIEVFCRNHPGVVLYGEVYGQVQDLKYGTKPGEVRFAAFDILERGQYWCPERFLQVCHSYKVPTVPVINNFDGERLLGIPYDFDAICGMAEEKTLIPGADHCREGVVVAPLENRYHDKLGRVKLKVVGAGYLERN